MEPSRRRGIDRIFGLGGDHVNPILDASRAVVDASAT